LKGDNAVVTHLLQAPGHFVQPGKGVGIRGGAGFRVSPCGR